MYMYITVYTCTCTLYVVHAHLIFLLAWCLHKLYNNCSCCIKSCIYVIGIQPNGLNTLLPSTNGMGDLSQPREAASDDSNLHPVGKKMSAPGILQPYNQVTHFTMFPV